jgi:hypothetical protein
MRRTRFLGARNEVAEMSSGDNHSNIFSNRIFHFGTVEDIVSLLALRLLCGHLSNPVL